MKMKWLIVFLISLLVCWQFFASHYLGYEDVSVEWTIYEKRYTPATVGTGGQWAFSSNGPIWIMGASGQPARYELLLRRVDDAGDLDVRLESVSEKEYVAFEVGDTYTTVEHVFASPWDTD